MNSKLLMVLLGIFVVALNAELYAMSANVGNNGSAKLTWDKVPNATSYKVLVNKKYVAGTSSQNYTVSGLKAGEHSFYVYAFDKRNSKINRSKTVQFTVPKSSNGSAMSANVGNNGSAKLTWDEVPNATSYKVLVNKKYVAGTSSQNYTVSGLKAGEHSFYVYAYDKRNNKINRSKTVQFTVPKISDSSAASSAASNGESYQAASRSEQAALPSSCGGSWQLVDSDRYGWLRNPIRGRGDATQRFSINEAPDGSSAVQHAIKRGQSIGPLGFDTSTIKVDSGYCGLILRYKMFNQQGKYRTQPGKYMALMGGRGAAGGRYAKSTSSLFGSEGWSLASMSPVIGSGGSSRAKNYVRGYVYSANREALGGRCEQSKSVCTSGMSEGECASKRECHGDVYGTNYGATPTGEWVGVDLYVGMNAKGRADGFAKHYINRVMHGHQRGVQWADNPANARNIWVRWRMMYGGTPSKLPPAYDFKEWYKDFEVYVAYPK